MALHARRTAAAAAFARAESSGYRRGCGFALAAGGALIVIGWLLPWGSAGGGEISGLSDTLQWWYRFLILGSGCLAVVAGGSGGRRFSTWLAAAIVVATTGWSLFFSGAVYLAARAAAGFGDATAITGPSVTHGVGAYALILGAVAVVVCSGPVATKTRGIWIATAALGALVGSILLIGLV